MTEIGFSEFGRVYVPIAIKPPDGVVMLSRNFKVDIGADFSTISKEVLARLGYTEAWVQQHVTVFKESEKPTIASGAKVNAGYVVLPLINI